MIDFLGFAGALSLMAAFAFIAAYRAHRWYEYRQFRMLLIAGAVLSLGAIASGWVGLRFPFYGYHADPPGPGWDCYVSQAGESVCTQHKPATPH
jgi:hypothetical protein